MNRNNSKRISQREIAFLLPEWFDRNYRLTFQLLSTNAYGSLESIRTFLTAALTDIACPEDEREKTTVKHVKVKVLDKGVNDGFQYVSVHVLPVMRDGTIYKIDKSCKVRIRPKMDRD